MITILQIETSTQFCSAALSRNGETIALKEASGQNLHAGSLTLFIDEVMQQRSLKYEDLDAIAVSKGPGSYTGLRIGVSTAKGLCFALDKPLIAIDTLKLMTAGFLEANPDFNDLVCPMIDARRLEVYTALYSPLGDEIVGVSAKIIDDNSFAAELRAAKITFIGDGAEKCQEIINNSNAQFINDNYNLASNMSGLAYQRFLAGNFEDVAYFEPFYLKDFMITTPKKKAG
jgi:tRNA threonylcarbamoyladenosine biosynthesis protein TsaB